MPPAIYFVMVLYNSHNVVKLIRKKTLLSDKYRNRHRRATTPAWATGAAEYSPYEESAWMLLG